MTDKFNILIIIGIIFIYTPLFANQNKRVAVLDVESKNISQTYADITRDIIELNLYKSGKFKVLERNQMNLVLKEQKLNMSGCSETKCAVEIGRVLSSDMVVVGSLYKLKDFTITIKFVDVNTGDILIAETEKANTDSDIEKAVNTLVNKIVESLTEEPFIPFDLDLRLSANGTFLIHRGDFNDLFNTGYGGVLSIYNTFNFFDAGIQSGCWYFPGRKNSKYFIMVPVLLSARYNLRLTKWLTITPVFSSGGSYNTLKFRKYYPLSDQWSGYRTRGQFELFSKAGLNILFSINRSFKFFINSEYGALLEEDGMVEFIIFNTGMNIKL